MEENFLLDLVSCLEQNKSQKQINADIKTLEKTINMLRLTGTFASADTKKSLNSYIKQLSDQLSTIKLKAEIDSKNIKADINKALNNVSFKDIDALNINENKVRLKVQKVIADTKAYVEKNPVSIGVNIDSKRSKLDNDLTTYLNKNTKITESSVLLKEADKVRDLIGAINDKKSLREATDAFQLYRSEVSATGFATKSTTDRIKSMLSHVTKLGSIFSVTSLAVNNFTKSLGTLKNIDDILTEISKTSNLTAQELEKLGDTSFESASKYGKAASDYLLGIQEMSRSGFYGEKGSAMAEQSLLAQAAGDMTADVANKYILATNAAYKYNGEAEKLNAVLDGQNSITNRNSVGLEDMALAMSEAGTVASSYRVSIEDLSAMIGTMEAVTKTGGSEVGNAIKSILINLQNVTSDKIVGTLNEANASMTEFVNGTEKMRNPISILRDLADTFNQLDEDDALRAEILTNIGGKHQASKLAALLQNMEMFDKMLVDYSEGSGSAMEEAMKSANNWSGKLNQLQNSWDSLVNSITSKNTVLNGLSFGDKLIQGAESFINTFGEIPVILTTLTAAMTTLNKDFGITQLVNPETKKFDIEGNLGIIDFTAIKNQKKHFEEAQEAIAIWNKKLKSGKGDLESFNYEVVQNNASLKEYLSTCSKDAPASLSGYKSYLNATGNSTDALRIKTILLNSAISMGIGIAIQAAVQGITYLIQKEENLREATQEAINTFESITTEVESLESKLSELNDQIGKLDPITDAEDIENLKAETEELNTQLAILKEKQRIAESDADKAAQASLNMTQASRYQLEERESAYGGVEVGAAYVTKDEELLNAIDAYEKYKAKVDEANEALAGMAETGGYSQKEWREQEQIIASYSEKMEDARSHANELASTISEQKQGLNGNTEASQELLDTIENTITKYDEWLDAVNGTTVALQEQAEAEKEVSETAKNITFAEAWANSFTSEDDKVKELGNTLLGLAEKGRLTKEIFNEADSTVGGYFANLGISAEEAVAKINKLVDESEQLSSMSGQISSMADALSTKLEDGFVSADTLSGFDVEVRGLDSWDKFQETLGSTTSSYEECQEAANALATEWVNSSDFLAQLTEQNEEYYKTQLEAMGIENYEEVISYAHALNEAKEVLSQSSLELGNATYDEIEALIAEGQYSELTANMILALYDAKIAEQAATIDTSADCANLIALAGDADRTSQSIQLLIQLMDIYSELESGVYDTNAATRAGALSVVNRIKGELEAIANGEAEKMEIEPTVKLGNRGKSSAKSAGKDAGKSLKDGLKEELSNLDSVISGITGRIDKQISVIKSQKEAALEAIDAQIDALNEQKSVLEEQKKALEKARDAAVDALEDERDAAVDALEDERDARIEVIELQKEQLEQSIKLIEQQIKDKGKVIKGIQDEIDAMQDANEQRKMQVNLMKEQYQLERLQHQRTILQYSKSLGMHYTTDTKNIHDQKQAVDDAKLEIEIAKKEKQISLIEKEIDLLNEKKDTINGQIDLLDEELDRVNKFYDAEIEKVEEFYDAEIKKVEEYYDAQIAAIDEQIDAIDRQIEALEKQREQTEKYYESLIENLENSKSKYEELKEIVEQAELSAALKQLGIDEEALLNGSEEEFEKLKNTYMGIVAQLNEGNDEFLAKLRELSGYDGTAPVALSDSNTELDTMNGNLDTANQGVGSVNESLTETATKTSDVATNVGELTTNLSGVSTAVTEEQSAFDSLKLKISEVIEAINLKTEAIRAEQDAVNIATSREMADFLLLKDKILEVQESISSISNGMSMIDLTPVNNLTNAFQALYDQIVLVATTLGVGVSMEGMGSGESEGTGTLNSIAAAINALNEVSLEDGIIAQFTNLKTAVDNVTAAIGGGSGDGESSGGEGSGSSKGNSSGSNGSEGEGGGSSLTSAITDMGETAGETIGEPGAEGDGTVIGEFGSMKTAVNEVATAIGSGGSEGSGQGDGEGSGDLISSITDLGDTTQEEMGEPDGDGIIGRFGEFRDVVGEANEHVVGISDGLEEIDGKEVECTIKVNIEVNGGLPAFAEGTLGNINLESGEYNAKYGKAFAEGTGGYKGLQKAEKNALVSEYGQTEMTVLPDGETIITDTPTMMDLPKDTVIYNEEQTKKIMDNKIDASSNAHAKGTDDEGWWTGADGHRYRDLRPGDRAWELQEIFKPMITKWKETGEEISNAYFEHIKQMEKWTKEITNNTAINNVTNNKNVQQPVTIHQNVTISCPNVTNDSGVENIQKQLGHLSQKAYQVELREY